MSLIKELKQIIYEELSRADKSDIKDMYVLWNKCNAQNTYWLDTTVRSNKTYSPYIIVGIESSREERYQHTLKFGDE